MILDIEIQPKVVRLDNSASRGSTARGYMRTAFEDAWARYLPAEDV